MSKIHFGHVQCEEQEGLHIWLALSVVFLKYLGLILLILSFESSDIMLFI